MAATRRTIGLGILVSAVALLSAASAPAKVNPDFWGVNYRFSNLSQEELKKIHKSGARTVRWKLSWPQVEPTKGSPDWSVPDGIIGGLAGKGIRVLPFVYGSPPYAASSTNTPPLGSDDARQAWKQFLRDAVDRYGPNGTFWQINPTIPKKPIRDWQIWSEPNLPGHFQPRPSAKRYATLLRISHDAIRDEDPKAKVVLAGLAAFSKIRGSRFLDRLYRVGGGVKGDFEVAASHPYAPTLYYLRYAIRHYRKVMKRHGDRHTPLWITEIGWGSGHPDGNMNKGPRGQKRMLKKSFKLILHNRKHWHIGRLSWFEWRDPGKGADGCSFCTTSGLLKHGGHPKPSFRAYKHFAH